MTDRVLKRYELQARQIHLEPLYPGAEVWLGRDTEVGLPATIITYPWAPEPVGSSTARALWSAEVRKLFRLSCQPFDPSLVGFVNGGFDETTSRLVLVTQDADLPSVQAWLSDGAGKSCASQWRGNHAPNRAELWDHIVGLFGALSSIHESRIVHRRIQPHNILVDEALSRDQPGFLKLGRFEASTFFRNSTPPRPADADETQAIGHDPWYTVDLGVPPAHGPMLGGTPAGDVYGLSLTALWLLSGRPKDNPDLYRFLFARSKGDNTDAFRIRRQILQEAVKQLFTPEERRFFEPLLSPKFALTASASRYRDRAEEVALRLRESALTAGGPLCLVLRGKAEDHLNRLWKDPNRPWRGAWLEESCRQGRFLPGVQDASANKYQAAILLPNGWALLCAVFLTGSGLDWNRLSISDVVDSYYRPSSVEPVSLAPYAVRILQGKQYAPANARPWRPFFVAAARAAKGAASPVQEALEQLNFAELAFWEEKVVPIRVVDVQITGKGEQRREEIEIEQLLADKEFPPNPPIRQPESPDFAAILEDKNLTRTRVELSDTSDLWDRKRQQARPVEA